MTIRSENWLVDFGTLDPSKRQLSRQKRKKEQRERKIKSLRKNNYYVVLSLFQNSLDLVLLLSTRSQPIQDILLFAVDIAVVVVVVVVVTACGSFKQLPRRAAVAVVII